ncbi:pentatricopeptide repeat-containing protein At3g46790, chloroplastic-like [Phoenix dactylifera]|uniref:Pentatricopeptide repeat-containing protein At3g46790, chloroplastic-like n=1 Tax=Phoenix dactylifera TaxID=42345 RepID=A0A8B7BS52_PHODC|nr:pentatricopeptide repeat-containing protein At3g46790, chloroplastic-like [Phoenix dactylifera]
MGVPEDLPFYASLLDSCAAARDLPTLRQAHARLLALGLASHRFIRSKLCASYARCFRLRDAHLLLSFAPSAPAFLYNSLIRAHANLGRHGPALLLLRHMLSNGPLPDARTLASALRAAAGLASLRLGRPLHAASLAAGLAPDPIVANSLVAMYSKCGDLASARHVFDRMRHRTLASWTAMIAACGAHGRAAEAVELFLRMLDEGEPPDAAAMTVVLAACARGGLAEAGRRVFDMMREGRLGGVRPGVEHYTCMVDLLGREGHVEEAEALLGEMEEEPDDALWRALLGACRMHGRLDVAERVANRVYGNLG